MINGNKDSFRKMELNIANHQKTEKGSAYTLRELLRVLKGSVMGVTELE